MACLRLRSRHDEPMLCQGLDSPLGTALVIIYSSPDHEMMPSALSDFLNSSRTHVTRVSKELVEQGYLRRAASQLDGRQVLLRLTSKGRRFVEGYLPQRRAQLTQTFASVHPPDRTGVV